MPATKELDVRRGAGALEARCGESGLKIAKWRIALALSGGGFRASVFHLGVLRRLSEAGWLGKVDAISTVSGGSIVGSFAALQWDAMLNDNR